MTLDKISEAIAHFAGLFNQAEEAGRLRKDYHEFRLAQKHAEQASETAPDPVAFRSGYEFDDPDPGLRYVPGKPDLVEQRVDTVVTPASVPVGDILLRDFHAQGHLKAHGSDHSMRLDVKFTPPEIPPPSSSVLQLHQENVLNDNDYASVGGHNLALREMVDSGQQLAALAKAALAADPFASHDDHGMPGSGTEIASFVHNLAETGRSLAATHDAAPANAPILLSPGTQATVSAYLVEADAILGNHVNGEVAAETPDLEDHLPLVLRETLDGKSKETAPVNEGVNGPKHVASGQSDGPDGKNGLGTEAPSVDVKTGGNLLANEVLDTNKGLFGTVTAVAGDHFELNMIIQINVYSDNDAVGPSLADWNAAPDATATFNIASFARVDGSGLLKQPANANEFPKFWAVTEITGDLMIMNWTKQLNLVSDNDRMIVSSSGVQTTLSTGGNKTVDSLDWKNIGKHYDLILIGGSVYDASVIKQTNILLDDDVVGAVRDFSTSGEGGVSTHDNLLWNQAAITTVGGADRFSGLSDGYKSALENFAAGDKSLSADIMGDSSFAGLIGLRVLYISGDLYDIHYISQTNFLGDADEIALAMNQGLAGAGADWSVSTGSNALINTASLLDLDSLGKTYVGGERYSDELLVQTDIIVSNPVLVAQNADSLVNEAVVFLGEGMLGSDQNAHGDSGAASTASNLGSHAGHNDIMQSVLS